MSDLLKRIYAAFGPDPLRADNPEQRELYVNLDEVRGEADVVHRLASRIRLNDGPTCQILAGHRGSGKSTELRRLKHALETGDERYFVVFCEVDRDIDRNDVDFLEVLVAIIRQMAAQLREHAGIKLKPGYFRDRWERITSLLSSKVELSAMELEVGLTTLSIAMKGSPDTRLKLRNQIESDTGNWLQAANDLIGEALLELKNDYSGLVILIDDLDKMVLRPHREAGCTTGEYLFIHREPQLSGFKCHTVYTMPLALAYSQREATIASLYGGPVPVVPMIRIGNCPPEAGDYKPGIEKCREIVHKRLQKIKVDQNKVFESPEVLDQLIRQSGGQPTELMYFVREALIASLPIDAAAVQRPVRERRKAYARQLRAEHWPIIEQVRRSGSFIRETDNEQAIRDLLDSRVLLQYVNDEEWYGVNPVIADLSSPTKT